MNHRRRMLAASIAALASPWVTAKPVDQKWRQGPNVPFPRVRCGLTGIASGNGYQTIPIAKAGVVYALPLSVLEFDESSGALFQFAGDGCITATQDVLVLPSFNIDWVAQGQVDDGLRKVLFYRVPTGIAPPAWNGMQPVQLPFKTGYTTLASHDTPGSSVPRIARASVAWTPGVVPASGSLQGPVVTLSSPSTTVLPGDAVQAGHTGIVTAGLLVMGTVVAPNQVAITLVNMTGAEQTVGPGMLNVLGETTVASTGWSTDGWTSTTAAATILAAGEKAFLAVRVGTAGDTIQVDNASYVQMTALVA